jgi:hypothetical protein|tara:strand:- start:1216 stop:1560 length:345 start_codon:yes stop_codon:yes gene_type:complete
MFSINAILFFLKTKIAYCTDIIRINKKVCNFNTMENQERKKYIMTNQGAIVLGLVWATFMVLYTQLLSPWLSGTPIDYDKLILSIPIWLATGLAFGFVMKYLAIRKEKRNQIPD